MKSEVSFVIPAYNEEGNISLICDEIRKSFIHKEYEIIFINDGSSDKTYEEIIKEIQKKQTKIKLINFSRNFGKEAGILAGLKHSTNKYTCIIDADMQQPPSVVKKMLEIIESEKDIDCVVAYQEKRDKKTAKQILSNYFYKIINKCSDVYLYPQASDFRLFNTNVKNSILQMEEKQRFSKGLFAYIGFNNYYLAYKPKDRERGKTKWSMKGLFKYAINGIFSFSTKLAILPFYFSIISLLFAIVLLILFLIKNMYFNSVFKIMVAFSFATLFFSFGIVGNYINAILKELKNRPIYFVKNTEDNFKNVKKK